MWKVGKGQEWVERGKHFDHILEPGDFSEAVDRGVTVQDRAAAHRVGPITLLDRDDVQTTAGGVAAHLLGRGVRVVVAQSPIARTALDLPVGAMVVNLYPLSPYLRAFDFAVSAAGYNSFHELISFGVPSVFLPNENTAYDDQVTRVRYAADLGAARWSPDPTSTESLEAILDPVVQKALSERCLELSPPNGAQAAANWVAELISRPGSGA
jgi:UDP:flavonoid glycosyltransferase YjiC (YdhE family)